MNLPEARKKNLVTTELDDEVVVYDPETKQAHSLNRMAVTVWNHCDGQSSLADLRRRVSAEMEAPISEVAVWTALQKLERAGLLAEKLSAAGPVTRREMLGKAGRYGAAAVATPLIVSALIPTAAAAVTLPKCNIQSNCNPPTNTCTCYVILGGGTTCLTSAIASPACVGPGAAGDAACVTAVGTGSQCLTPSGSAISFCTCASTAQCPGGTCVDSSAVHLCHLACPTQSCAC